MKHKKGMEEEEKHTREREPGGAGGRGGKPGEETQKGRWRGTQKGGKNKNRRKNKNGGGGNKIGKTKGE